jgi:hypothetical protein
VPSEASTSRGLGVNPAGELPIDGEVIWDERGDDVWLSLAPDESVTLDDLLTEVARAGYEEIDTAALEAALDDRLDRRVAVVAVDRRRGVVVATVADDGMSATVRVRPAGATAPALTPADARAALTAAAVTHGIDEEVVDAIPYDRSGVHVVARGVEPVDGEDGDIVYEVDATQEIRPATREDGGVDLHAAATIPTVRAGDLLATIVPGTHGESGWTVRGEELLARTGRPPNLPKTKNVEITADGLQLVATIDGLLERSHTHLVVRPDLAIGGDVDFESGSIDFHGDVLIGGSVRPGFHVHAGGRVIIAGDVEQADVEAEALVWVRGAVVGDRCVVRSNGDVKVRTVHEGRIEARGSVFIEKEANDATILAAKDVVLESPRNRIVGGSAWAGHEVIAAEIGAVGELPTRVTVGIDPFTAEETQSLQAERTTQLATLDRVEASVGRFVEQPSLLEALDDDRRAAADRLVTARAALLDRIAQLDARLSELACHTEDQGEPRIVARLAVRPGAVLTVRRARRTVDVPRFRVAAVDVAGTVELKPLERDAARIPRNHVMK